MIKTEDKDLEEMLKEMVTKLGGLTISYDEMKEKGFNNIDILILDTRETKEDEIVSFISNLKKIKNFLEIIVLTCKHNIRSSILAMKSGASDELLFPIEVEKLEKKIKTILERVNLAKKERR